MFIHPTDRPQETRFEDPGKDWVSDRRASDWLRKNIGSGVERVWHRWPMANKAYSVDTGSPHDHDDGFEPSYRLNMGRVSSSRNSRIAAQPGDTSAETATLEFSTAVYYCEENEGVMDVDVVRVGSLKGRMSVDYRTLNGSATAGVHFGQSAGTLTFNPGEVMKTLSIKILRSKVWNPTLEFACELLDPSSGAQLSPHLNHCRVWIIHHGSYPSESIDNNSTRMRLLYEFYRRCLHNKVVRVGTIKTLIIDQLSNLLYIWQLVISVWFVDHGARRVGPREPTT